MKKIIAAFDGLKFSESTKAYAIQLAKQSKAQLVGVFLEDFSYTGYKIYDLISTDHGSVATARKKFDKKDVKSRAAAINHFETACRDAGLEYTTHKDRNVAIRELLHESIYADLLIIDRRETLTHYPEKTPTGFIRDLLTHVQCPVLVVPHLYKPIDKIVLLYDGEPSSVHAIKMFSYMLGSFKEYPMEVLSVNSPSKSLNLPDNKLMKEFMKHHFPKSAYTVIKGSPEVEIINYLKGEKDTSLVVLGAYRRGLVSRLFRPSMADGLMAGLKLPLFIAHNK